MTYLAYDVDRPCLGRDDLFHGPDKELPSDKAAREAEAKSLCFNCPTAVRESCLQIAMDNEHGLSAGNRDGIYGGLNEQERADLDGYDPRLCTICNQRFETGKAKAAHSRTHKPIEHGTDAGYAQHKRRKQKPCDACLTAHNEYNTSRRRQAAA